jgi:hypothetical protein
VTRVQTALARLLLAHATAVERRSRSALVMPSAVRGGSISATSLPAGAAGLAEGPALYVSYQFPAKPVPLPAAAVAEGSGVGRPLDPVQVILACPLTTGRGEVRTCTLNAFHHARRGSGGGAGGEATGVTTSFPLAIGGRTWTPQRALAEYLVAALGPDATPEDGDIAFTLSLLPPPPLGNEDAVVASAYAMSVLATAAFSLGDLVVGGADLEGMAIPLAATDNARTLASRYVGNLMALPDAGDAMPAEAVGEALRRNAVVADLTLSVAGAEAIGRLLSR